MLVQFTSHRPSNARGFLFAYQAGNYDETSEFFLLNMDLESMTLSLWTLLSVTIPNPLTLLQQIDTANIPI